MEETTRTSPGPLGGVAGDTDGGRWESEAGLIAAVVRVEGTLELTEPLHLGGVDEDDPENVSDLPLLTDPRGDLLLPGATLAGALRAYLDARRHGFPANGTEEERGGASLATALFGERGVDDPAPSIIHVDDACGKMPEGRSVELYEGNRLAGATRTAAKEALFSRTAWPAGTTFDLHFEVPLPADEEEATRYCTALVSALRGLEGEAREAGIRLGGRKRRGFGRVRAKDWRVRRFDLADPEDFLLWVRAGNEPLNKIDGSRACRDVSELRDVLKDAYDGTEIISDARKLFFVEAECTLPHGLLDRTAGMTRDPDAVHRRAYDAGRKAERPVLTGTQMGGALRARAHRIARTLGPESKARTLVEAIFGSDPEREEEELRAGRLWIDRSFIERDDDDGDNGPVGLMDLVQNRIQLDPWTQAPAHGALFDERPVRGGSDVQVTLRWRLDQPERKEIGLLLHLLKDLWTGDLAVAGTQSIGRGQFDGQEAAFILQDGPGPRRRWKLKATGADDLSLRFIEGSPEELNRCADALTTYFDRGAAGARPDAASSPASPPADE